MPLRTPHSPQFQAFPLDDAVGLRLVGELDLATIGDFRAMLATLPESADGITLDFADLSFMDSTGLHAVLEFAATLNGGKPLNLENVPPHIRQLFEITGTVRDPAIELRSGDANG